MFKSTPFKRSQRVSDLIRKEVANIFLFELRDPRLKNITISRVDMSDDLSNATIYYFSNFLEIIWIIFFNPSSEVIFDVSNK